jgi:hypothetical protein
VFQKVGRKRADYEAVHAITNAWGLTLDHEVDHISVTESGGKRRQWNYYGSSCLPMSHTVKVPAEFLPSLEVQLPGVKHWIGIPSEDDWRYDAVRPMFFVWRKKKVHHISVTVEDAELGELKWRFRYAR